MLLVLCLLASFAMQIWLLEKLSNKSDQAPNTDVGQTMLASFARPLNGSTENNLLTCLLACLSLPVDTVLVSVLSSFTCKLHKILNLDDGVRCKKIIQANCSIYFLSFSFIIGTNK